MFDMIMFDMNNVWRMNQYYSVSRPACGAGPTCLPQFFQVMVASIFFDFLKGLLPPDKNFPARNR